MAHPEMWPVYPRYRGKKKHKISANLRLKVYARDGYKCLHCGGNDDLTCDHVIPESRNGPTTLENLQTLCRKCNNAKGVK